MIRKFKFSQQGFFSIQFVFFISLISVTLISYGYVFYAQKRKDQFRKMCYFDLVDIQKSLVKAEKQLFLLNLESSALRFQLKLLYIELAAATAAQNYPLVTQIGLDIESTIALQKKLDLLQKKLIQTADYNAKFQLVRLNTEIFQQYNQEKRIWASQINETSRYNLKMNPALAVQTDSIGGLAPNYELKNNYQQLQELTLTLQYQFSNRQETQTLLKTRQDFQFSCRVSFIKKDQVWDLKINQDRHL